ncbi:MAG: M23 family metallopeptidase [Alphaproteobacteria bacterium]|mgnify:CR=1 FL=1|jgi:murein DD-endopeptidase MepM/ murein hydrolase activator NlpD|nr:M23 family metallopeptidase [Alphaproteobacteria bacterium]MDP6565663.1 M23 family metallopeptidase [Alphaproteobacteria bacterium]MDP6813680.1 M23 family metallopeptidase [Alphaproteobacteria bacterium]
MRWLVVALALSAAWPLSAAELLLRGDFVQGGLVQGETAPGSRVELDGRALRVGPDGRFIFGFGRDFAERAVLVVRLPDGGRQTRTLEIRPRTYRIQRIDGLPPKMVTPPAAVLARIRRENRAIAEVRRRDSERPWFDSGFVWPAKGTITGVFGSQRVLNGKPRRPHYGLDIAAPVGSPVRAPADGVVAMAEADLYYTGGTVMLDHGHGLTSVYSHLHEVLVETGRRVRQGELIGSLGGTGRATGPHLDWRVNWFSQRLDPALLVGPMPE